MRDFVKIDCEVNWVMFDYMVDEGVLVKGVYIVKVPWQRLERR